MVNQVILIGRVGQEPVVRNTPAGLAVVEVSLATDTGWGDKKKTQWHRVTFWREAASKIGLIVKKGDTLYVEGSIDYQEYEKNGQKVQKVVIQGSEWRHLIAKNGKQLGPVQSQAPEDDLL